MTGSNLSKIIQEYFGLNTWTYLGDITFLILLISIVTINSAVEDLEAEEDSKISTELPCPSQYSAVIVALNFPRISVIAVAIF